MNEMHGKVALITDAATGIGRASIPAGRMAEAIEVAESALWLCSDRSSYVNGSFLAVDGGFLAQ